MSYSMSGFILHIYEEKQVTERFKVREFVIKKTDNNGRDQFIKCVLHQTQCEMIDNWNVGEYISFDFSVEGREWNGKYYNSLVAYSLRGKKKEVNELPDQPVTIADNDLLSTNMDDLPF